MIRDNGPNNSLGFGVTRGQLPPDGETEAANPESGIFARALHGNPIARFFATTAATVVGAGVAGALVRKGGLRLLGQAARQAAGSPGGFWDQSLKSYRDVQGILDEVEGLTRIRQRGVELKNGRIVEDADNPLADWTDRTRHGFIFTQGEKQRARTLGMDTPAEWTMRDELQQRLVRQARRLPYELPAAYVTQRLVSDRLLGVNQEERPNWKNPIDVVGDFAQQSVKNVAFAMLPFEAGVGAAKQTWRRAMSLGADQGPLNTNVSEIARDFSVSLESSLGLVGQQVSDLLYKTTRYSQQTAGSIATAVREASGSAPSIPDTLHRMRHGSGGMSGFLERITRGQEQLPLGPFSNIHRLPGGFRQEWRRYDEAFEARDAYLAGRVTDPEAILHFGVNTRIGQMVGSIQNLGRRGPRDMESFREGQFYQGMLRNTWRTSLARKLIDGGVEEEAARDFTRKINVRGLPTKFKQETNISHRIGFGVDDIHEGSDDWLDVAFYERIKTLPDAQRIRDVLPTAMRQTDQDFVRRLGQIDDKITRSWVHFYKGDLATEARNVLGMRKAAYGEFDGAMAGDAAEFLIRRSAERAGIQLKTPAGVPKSTTDIRTELRRKGLDPSNKYQLRSYLVEKGDISKPWNPRGYNFLGLQPLSVQEAMDRKLFGPGGEGDNITAEVHRLGNAMRQSDWDPNVLSRLKVGGVFKTPTDNIVDFTPILRAGRTFMDKVASELQIPFIHIKPLQLLGYGIQQDVANSPFMQFTSGHQMQPFLRQADQGGEGYMWMRGRRGRGRVLRFGEDEFGRPDTRWMEGAYRPLPTDAGSLAGRNVRLAAGDQGRIPDKPQTPWQRFWNVDPHQPDSFLEAFRRFRAARQARRGTGPGDVRYSPTFITRLRRGDQMSPEELATGVQYLERHVRPFGFSRNVIERAAPDSELARITAYTRSHIDEAGNEIVRTTPIPDTAAPTLLRATREAREETPESLGIVNQDKARRLRRSQNTFLNRWADTFEQRALDQPLPQALHSVGLHRRIDEMRLDFMRHLAIRQGLRGTSEEFSQFSARLLSEIDQMRAAGLINPQEVAEARAAVGSIQISYLAMVHYNPRESIQTLRLRIAEAMQQSQSMMGILEDVATHQTTHGGPIRRGIVRGIKQRFGFGRQMFDGTEYNPFGGTQGAGTAVAFVPTFGTAAARNPMAAIASTLGLNTWSNTEAFSASGIASSHIFNRMNKAIGGFNLSVDATQYKGPLDMMARGMVLQRAVPITAAGATLMTIDRTIGGYTQPRDESGERVYSPFVLGAVGEVAAQGQIMASGIVPGGLTADEREEQLRNGEVAVRKGRWWPLGNTPWKGGKVQYYRPSWYRRLQSGYQYTDQGWSTPTERLLFGYDFSPLRPLDPYRYEREHYWDRPYPVTGDYFTGPWGPTTGALNSTVGRILKPRQMMHEKELQWNLARYQQAGAYGMAAPASGVAVPNEPTIMGAIQAHSASAGSAAYVARNDQYMAAASTPAYASGSVAAQGSVMGGAQAYAAAAGTPAYASGSVAARSGVFANNEKYLEAANRPAPLRGISTAPAAWPFTQDAFRYNPYDLANPRRPANPMLAAEPISPGSFGYQASELGYQIQEWAGIYGFSFGVARTALGFGDQDMNTRRPVLASPSGAYGSTRAFWDLNLGGLGDFPTPLEGNYSNLEVSEIVRRFVPKARRPNEINPIANNMGKMHPWLPGNNYFKNFQWGDPYTQIQEGEMRLPGAGYERFNRLHPDETGTYGRLDRFRILADVAPYSNEFRQAATEMRQSGMTAYEQQTFEETLTRVEDMKRNNDFAPYQFKYSSAEEQGMGELEFQLKRTGEWFAHRNTYFNTKFLPTRTAAEDWERENVYGASFAQWQNPISDFLMPAVYRATTRNPISAALGLGFIGRMFGATPQAKAVGGFIGGAVGFTAGMVRGGEEALTGERFVPRRRRQEMALEEYTDILQYVKSSRAYQMAKAAGQEGMAVQFQKQMRSTLYGSDIYDGTLGELEQAIPKRKREHFRAFLSAPVQERARILSTAPRLERRIYQAAWGMPVEERPDLAEYFGEHELPSAEWEGWDPRVSMDLVKIKMGQAQGLDMSQMGYYPQQLREANLINPSYPDFRGETSARSARVRLHRLMASRGIPSSDVREITTPYSGNRLQVSNGIY